MDFMELFGPVLLATVISWLVGALWYSPLFFGNVWMKYHRITKKEMKNSDKKDMFESMIINFFSLLIMATIFNFLLGFAGFDTLKEGALFGFLIWFGFIAVANLNAVLWENQKIGLYWINTGQFLVILLIQGMILSIL